MADYEPRDMSGALFRNTKKEKEAQPDYQGDLVINGTKYRLAGWGRAGKAGKFLKIVATQSALDGVDAWS